MQFTHRQQREVFHLIFLEQLLKVSDSGFFVLKGGANLRFFFRSPRYSEDLDVDVLGGSVSTLRKNGYKILDSALMLRSLKAYGISELRTGDREKAKHTATTQRFRVQLLTTANESLPTKIEFSRRGSRDNPVTDTIDGAIVLPYRLLAYSCQHYPAAAAARQKIHALAGRSAVQARDVFDLYVLHLGGHEFDLRGLNAELRCKAQEQLLSLEFKHYSDQVLPFLEEGILERFGDREAWTDMRDFVFRLLEDEP